MCYKLTKYTWHTSIEHSTQLEYTHSSHVYIDNSPRQNIWQAIKKSLQIYLKGLKLYKICFIATVEWN